MGAPVFECTAGLKPRRGEGVRHPRLRKDFPIWLIIMLMLPHRNKALRQGHAGTLARSVLVQHQASRSEQAAAFVHHCLKLFGRYFVQHDIAQNEIEVTVGKPRGRPVHLMQMDRYRKRLCPQVSESHTAAPKSTPCVSASGKANA